LQALAAVSTTYYALYLCAGMIVVLGGWGSQIHLFIYMVWFFPLLVFNNLVNSPSVCRFLARFLIVSPLTILVAFSSRLLSLFSIDFVILVVGGCLSYLCFGLMLNAVSRYREAYIVERERTESMRIESEVLESISDCFISLDSEFKLVYLNDAACSEFSVKRCAALNKTIADAIPGFFSYSMLDQLRDSLSQTSVSTFEAQNEKHGQWYIMRCYQRRDGMSVYFRNITESVLSRQRMVRVNQELASEITGRKRSEEALRQTEERFRQVVEGAPIGMYIATDGIFRYLNPAAIAMFGAESADEIIGRHFLERIHQDSRSAVIERALQVMEKKTAVPFLEERLLRLDGTVFDGEVTAMPLIFEGREGAFVFVCDITERKREEREKQELEQQLRQSQKMEAIGQMAGAVAHDFNNLLMGISCQTELLMKTPDPRKAEERAKAILSATESAGELTKKLLAFSRIQELATSTFNLNDLVDETKQFVGCLMPETIGVDTHLSSAPCWVHADRVQTEQVVINLVLNARDAMPEGGALILSVSPLDITADDGEAHDGVPCGAYAVVSVADTGHGIPEQILGKIFEPFFTTKPKERGTGLGLAIARGVVSQSGGHIRVKSVVGAGTTLSIYLPSVEQPQAEPPKLHPCPLEISEASCPREGTVLVVDDEGIVRRGIRGYLELNGLTVIDCADAPEALKVASELKDRLALLITDVVMPNMTGIELARTLVKQMPELPIIFMSGYAAGRKGHEEFSQAKFLQKPFACATLLDTVCKGLQICPRQGKRPD
jgi:PAS domain S-box-containing protein